MRIRVDTTGLTRLVRRLEAQTRSNGDLHDSVKRTMTPRIAEPFLRQRTPEGQPWAPLAPATVAQRLRRGFAAGPPLIRSGRLFRSMQRVVSDGNTVRFGPSPDYGSHLNQGTNRMLARRFTPRGDELPFSWRVELEEDLERTIDRGAR